MTESGDEREGAFATRTKGEAGPAERRFAEVRSIARECDVPLHMPAISRDLAELLMSCGLPVEAFGGNEPTGPMLTPATPDHHTTSDAVLDALPDLPEFEESKRESEMLWELRELTKGLPRRATGPTPKKSGMFGPYELVEKIAIGGMAEVFKAKRTGAEGFEKVVAVKRILPHLSTNRDFVVMFVDEAKVVARLSHPNIVPIYDFGRIENSYYIAMEFLHGRDLRSILVRGRKRSALLPTELAVFIAARVCAGLDYAHKKRDEEGRGMRIVHRDVSPQNILISFHGEVKLTDFGIAKATHKVSVTQKGTLRGKVTYMSPEQASGEPMDHRSDLFSLGVVLYEMLVGRRPFSSVDRSDRQLLQLVRECRFPPPTLLNHRIPGDVERVVLKALSRRPEDRYPDARSMLEALESTPAGRITEARDMALYLAGLYDHRERDDQARPGTATVNLERAHVMYASDSRGGSKPQFEAPPLTQLGLFERFGGDE